MKQFNWKYYFVLLLFVPVLLKVFMETENHITFLWTFFCLWDIWHGYYFQGLFFINIIRGEDCGMDIA